MRKKRPSFAKTHDGRQGDDHMVQKGKSSAAAVRQSHVSQAQGPFEPGLDRNIQARIGDNLRAMYDELLQQPVPDRFKDLLGQFEKQRDGKEHGR
jgi:Anti-sigma factor NepR